MTRSALLLYVCAGAAAFVYGADWIPSNIPAWIRYHRSQWVFQQKYTPSIDPFWNGPEILMVYIGQRNCAPSNALELPQMVEDIKADLHRLSEDGGARFRVIGLALDPSPEDGLTHLARFGKFDELYVGGGMFSDAAMEFLWQEFPGVVATPQIVLIRRDRVSQEDLQAPVEYAVRNAVEVDRMIGLDGIGSWSANRGTATVLRRRLAGEPQPKKQ